MSIHATTTEIRYDLQADHSVFLNLFLSNVSSLSLQVETGLYGYLNCSFGYFREFIYFIFYFIPTCF